MSSTAQPPGNDPTDAPADPQRRAFCRQATVSAVGLGCALHLARLAAESDGDRPVAGDRLVAASAGGARVALRVSDVPLNAKPLLALPFDRASGSVRDGSRLSQVLLLRLPPESLDAGTLAHSPSGVLAFSAICTHQGCVISEWLVPQQNLMCYCHFSKFDVRASGSVTDGPAPRRLPYLPLAVESDELVVAGPFSAQPGVKREE